MSSIVQVILLAFILDAIVGDPQNPIHPVRIIGNAIFWAVNLYKRAAANFKRPFLSFLFGTMLTLLVVSITYLATRTIVDFTYNIHSWAGFCLEVVLCYFVIAARALNLESMKVYHSLQSDDLQGARTNLSYIVGRDTENLSTDNVIKATVETVSENLSDGVIAPLIFVFIGGVPLGMAYKAVNTLDSMIGYKNETFEYFGKFAAKLDDAVNFVPARISAILMIVAVFTTGGDAKRAIRVYSRDRHNHKSPNSAQTESVCAGALGLQLGGDNYYKGMLVRKPTIGERIFEPSIEHIRAANRMMYATSILAIISMIIIDRL